MSVSFARPDILNLEFHLYGRSVHPELFQVYAESEVWQQAYMAVIRICEAGHTVGFRFGETTITEVTATRQQALPMKKRFFERRLRGNKDESFQFEGGLQYHVSYQLEQLDPEVFLNFNEELLIDCARAEVSHRFPPGNRLDPQPLSLIRTDIAARSLLIHAFHTFPESSAVVKTQSLFEF
jgi:hypothetical protein